MIPKLNGIDHIHVYGKDRETLAAWYQEVMGFKPVSTLALWAENPGGPLTIEDPGGTIHLAIFQSDSFVPANDLALGATGTDFLAWQTHLEGQDIPLVRKDHQVSWSLYFKDLYGNLIEITTYDYKEVAGKP